MGRGRGLLRCPHCFQEDEVQVRQCLASGEVGDAAVGVAIGGSACGYKVGGYIGRGVHLLEVDAAVAQATKGVGQLAEFAIRPKLVAEVGCIAEVEVPMYFPQEAGLGVEEEGEAYLVEGIVLLRAEALFPMGQPQGCIVDRRLVAQQAEMAAEAVVVGGEYVVAAQKVVGVECPHVAPHQVEIGISPKVVVSLLQQVAMHSGIERFEVAEFIGALGLEVDAQTVADQAAVVGISDMVEVEVRRLMQRYGRSKWL